MSGKIRSRSESKIDDKNRFVLPSHLCKELSAENEELFLFLSKSDEGLHYIKIIENIVLEKHINPLKCDSLQLAKEYQYSRTKLFKKNRIQLNIDQLKWLFGEKNDYRSEILTCLWAKNHIAIVDKTKFDISKLLS